MSSRNYVIIMGGAAISIYMGIQIVRQIDGGVRAFNLTFGCATATARVFEIFEREHASEGPIAFYKFRALNGKPYFGEISGVHPSWKPGTELEIIYNRMNPEQHRSAVDEHNLAVDLLERLFSVFFLSVFFYLGVMVALRGAMWKNN